MSHQETPASDTPTPSETSLIMLGSVANQIEYAQSLLRAACLDRHLVTDGDVREEIAAMATQLEALRHRAIRVFNLVKSPVRDPGVG